MKGKKTFTKSEETKIKKLIIEKLNAPAEEQKRIRDKIRAVGFYYSDFTRRRTPGGYNIADFDLLVSQGRVLIKD